ncbi:MAG: preprotein translocase subunit TatC [Thermoproteus sp.]|nr:preprotein translocase subunit TatC [Thermoproteus sp.]
MSLLDHLQELGQRLKRVFTAAVVVFLLTLMPTPQYARNPLQFFTGFLVTGNFTTLTYDVFYRSIIEPAVNMSDMHKIIFIAGHVFNPFNVLIYISAYFTLLIILPYLMYEVWAYVRPALYPQEVRAVRKYLIVGVALFYLGNIYGLLLISRYFLRFLIGITGVLPGVTPVFDISSIVSTIVQIALWSGVFFEAPIVLAVFSELCMLNPWGVEEYRPIIYAVALIIIAIFTPDATLISVFLTFIPFAILFEIGLVFSKKIVKKCPEYKYLRQK